MENPQGGLLLPSGACPASPGGPDQPAPCPCPWVWTLGVSELLAGEVGGEVACGGHGGTEAPSTPGLGNGSQHQAAHPHAPGSHTWPTLEEGDKSWWEAGVCLSSIPANLQVLGQAAASQGRPEIWPLLCLLFCPLRPSQILGLGKGVLVSLTINVMSSYLGAQRSVGLSQGHTHLTCFPDKAWHSFPLPNASPQIVGVWERLGGVKSRRASCRRRHLSQGR